MNTIKSTKAVKINDSLYDGLNINEQNILKSVIDENERSNNWVRLFPTSGIYFSFITFRSKIEIIIGNRLDTWEFFAQFFENKSTPFNMMLHKKMYPKRLEILENIIINNLI
jgi:hypothetical protein